MLFLLLILVQLGFPAFASQLIYQPILPSFGGNPLNWSGLFSEAEKQNIYHAKVKKTSPFAKSPLDRFKEQLTYMILSRLADKIVSAAFGQEELEPGTYEIGGYQVNVKPSETQIEVEIIDTTTGSTTTVQVPMYGNTE